MKIFGMQVWKPKAAVGVTQMPTSAITDSWFWPVLESFAGAWQRNIVCETPKNMTAFSAVYACIDLIARDIAKLRPMLKQQMADGTWQLVDKSSPFWVPLRKPNFYQTYIQFLSYWITSKLLWGNTYVLKEREDLRGMIRRLYVLDPRLVIIKVTEDGGVYYELKTDNLSRGQEGQITVPASEMIHDRAITLWHPLVGVSPLYAAGASATQGIRIQNNSARFFENMSRPSGMLTAPDNIDDDTAKRLKLEFEKNFSGSNIGRMMVSGSGLEYKPFTMPPEDAQMIQQLEWTIADVCRPFHMPVYKLSAGEAPKFTNYSALNQDYYTQTLQTLIEEIEVLLSEGLELNKNDPNTVYAVKLDIANLLRMDPMGRAEVNAKLVAASIKSPNEARLDENLTPVKGGDTPYIQQQNWPISMLADRPAPIDPGSIPPPPAPAPADPAPPAEPKSINITVTPPAIGVRDSEISDEGAVLAAAADLTNGLLAKFATTEMVE